MFVLSVNTGGSLINTFSVKRYDLQISAFLWVHAYK